MRRTTAGSSPIGGTGREEVVVGHALFSFRKRQMLLSKVFIALFVLSGLLRPCAVYCIDARPECGVIGGRPECGVHLVVSVCLAVSACLWSANIENHRFDLFLCLLSNKTFEPNLAGVGWCYSTTSISWKCRYALLRFASKSKLIP